MALNTLELLGYNKIQREIIVSNISLVRYHNDTLAARIKKNYIFLRNYGYTKEDIIKMTLDVPSIYSRDTKFLKKKLDYMESIGYKQEEIKKITKRVPEIIIIGLENMQNKHEAISSLGFSHKDVLTIIKRMPELYALKFELINTRIRCLEEMGFSEKCIKTIIKGLPNILGQDIKTIDTKINNLIRLGYTKDEVFRMCENLPNILGLSCQNIERKIRFFDYIGIHNAAYYDTVHLMQSVELTYARYMFFKSINVDIDETNYYKLFQNQTNFKRKYNLDNNELLSKYPYEEFELSQLNNKNKINIKTNNKK